MDMGEHLASLATKADQAEQELAAFCTQTWLAPKTTSKLVEEAGQCWQQEPEDISPSTKLRKEAARNGWQ